MKTGGRRIAIVAGVIAAAVAGGLVAYLEVVPFEVRYNVGDILSKVREDRPEIPLSTSLTNRTRPRTPDDDASDRLGLAELIIDSTGIEEGTPIRVENDTLIATAPLHKHATIWNVLRRLREPQGF